MNGTDLPEERLESFTTRLDKIERSIREIEARNQKVELDKAWETSQTRRVGVALLTFIFTGTVLFSIGVDKALTNALIPTTGYIVSTFSLPWIKRWWAQRKKSPGS